MQRHLKTGLAVLAAGALFAAGGATSATAAKLITGEDIKNGSVSSVDIENHSLGLRDLNSTALDAIADKGAKGETGAQGTAGKDGAKGDAGAKGDTGAAGKDGLTGAVYRVENYVNGGGGDATVACADDATESQKYTAIAGGVQAGHLGSNDFAVSASFPGRMDWDTGEPKAGRLDGWIVLGNGKYTDNLKVWALCVPNTSIAVQTVNLEN